jgi:hypothetical protein
MDFFERDLDYFIRRYGLAKEDRPVSKTFETADNRWIFLVTGIDMNLRQWEFKVDETILPSPGFVARFGQEMDRDFLLNLFLSDILQRPEFEGKLQMFSDFDISANGNSRSLKGRMDHVIGFGTGPDALNLYIPCVYGGPSMGTVLMYKCIAQMGSLYKLRLDAGMHRKGVWGIYYDEYRWQFFRIDDDGFLWRGTMSRTDPRTFREHQALPVYRTIHKILQCCFLDHPQVPAFVDTMTTAYPLLHCYRGYA